MLIKEWNTKHDDYLIRDTSELNGKINSVTGEDEEEKYLKYLEINANSKLLTYEVLDN